MSIRAAARTAKDPYPKNFPGDQTSWINSWNEFDKEHNLTEIPFSGIMTKKVEDYMVESYQKQGFYHSEIQDSSFFLAHAD